MNTIHNLEDILCRDVIAGSTHLRQVTVCSTEIDQATAIQDLDDAGPVFGRRMQFETMESHIEKRPYDGAERAANVDWRQIAFVIYAFFRINIVQGSH